MLRTNLKRIFKTGFFSFFRNSFVSLSSILVMIITLAVITGVVFFSAVLNTSLETLRDKVDVNVYFITEAAEQDILSIKSSLEKLPEVARVEYFSREQELEGFKQRHENDQFTLQALDELGENPLGAKLTVKAKEPQQYEGIASFLQGDNVLSSDGKVIIDTVNYLKNKDAIDRLGRIIDSSRTLGLFFTIILVLISILITFNTIRLVIFISREEISVMRLVGASPFYIRGPFVVAGVMYGVISGIITLALFFPLTLWLGDLTQNFFIGLNIFDYYIANFVQIFFIVIVAGIFIGALSSYLAVRRYLKM